MERLKHHIEQHYTIAIAPNPENGSDKEASGEESETKQILMIEYEDSHDHAAEEIIELIDILD